MRAPSDWPLISVVVVGYRRPDLLERTMAAMRAVTTYPRLEYILSDDGSPLDMQARMRQLPFDAFVMAQRNQGLGRNNNKGLDAAHGDYILHLQDDWLCQCPPDFLQVGIQLLNERPDVGIIRYRDAPFRMKYETYTMRGGQVARIYHNGQHKETGEYAYADTPHLKRKDFHQRLGRYREGVPMTKMETDMYKRMERQSAIRLAVIEGYLGFEHIGAEASFNPTARQRALRARLLKNWITRYPFMLYLLMRGRKI